MQEYTKFLQDLQKLPSAPKILLVTPIYSTQSIVGTGQVFKLNELDGAMFDVKNTCLASWENNNTDMSVLVAKVAEAAGIPFENLVDSEKVIKMDSQ